MAEIVYRCATADMPIHNAAGADAVGLAQMLDPARRQKVLEGLMARLPTLQEG